MVYTRQVVIWALQVSSGEAFRKRKNSGFDTRVLVAICAHADSTGFYSWVGQRRIASIAYAIDLDEVTDSHVRVVRRSIAFLEDQDCLVVRPRSHVLPDGRAINGYDLAFAEVEVVHGELVEDVA